MIQEQGCSDPCPLWRGRFRVCFRVLMQPWRITPHVAICGQPSAINTTKHWLAAVTVSIWTKMLSLNSVICSIILITIFLHVIFNSTWHTTRYTCVHNSKLEKNQFTCWCSQWQGSIFGSHRCRCSSHLSVCKCYLCCWPVLGKCLLHSLQCKPRLCGHSRSPTQCQNCYTPPCASDHQPASKTSTNREKIFVTFRDPSVHLLCI